MIVCGDCLDIMAMMEEDSVDSIITDPPYGLGFMGKDWDHGVPGKRFWEACLRVAKPGAHLLAFGGTRTFHRLAVAIEDAGWEIRDTIGWLYGSGFPKSHNVGKAIDKINGENGRALKFTKWMRSTGLTSKQINDATGTFMASHYLTDKSQPAIPTRELFEKLRPLLSDIPDWVEELIERIEAEREVIGNETKARKTDSGIPLPTSGDTEYQTWDITAPATEAAKTWDGWGTALKPAVEFVCMARKPFTGTVAGNVLEWGTGAINIDGCRVGTDDDYERGGTRERTRGYVGIKSKEKIPALPPNPNGRWPANVIHDGSDEVLAVFPESVARPVKPENIGKSGDGTNKALFGLNSTVVSGYYDKETSAARFFKSFPLDNICTLCYNTITKDSNKEYEQWRNLFVSNAEKNSWTTQAINELIALLNAMQNQREKFVQNVKFAGSLCDSCATNIVAALVGIKHLDFNEKELQVILDFTGSYNKNILIQSLVSFAELWGNTDTIPTIESLSILFGYVQHVIENYTRQESQENGNGQERATRFKYTAKASRSERGEGNKHPTVKPLALMRYLCRLVTPPNGVVFDPFMGSGSTGVAAIQEGFKFIGCDIEEEYCQIAKRRIDKAIEEGVQLGLEI